MIEGAPVFFIILKGVLLLFPIKYIVLAEFAMRILDYVIEVYAILYFHV